MSSQPALRMSPDLDALFPGMAPGSRPLPPPEGGGVRALEDRRFAPALPPPRRTAYLDEGPVTRDGLTRRSFGAYWAHPTRTLWTPMLAGVMARLSETEGKHHPEPDPEPGLAESSADSPLTDDRQLSRAMFVPLAGLALQFLQSWWGEARSEHALRLGPSASLVDRVRVLRGLLDDTTLPAPFAVAMLPALLTRGRGQDDQFLQATGLYRQLGDAFGRLAARQGITTWEQAWLASRRYWEDERGMAFLRSLSAHRSQPAAVVKPEPRPVPAASPESTRLEAELVAAREALGRLRDESDARLARVAALQRELAEARQARERSVDRARQLEAELAALRTPRLAAEPSPSPAPLAMPAEAPVTRTPAASRPRLAEVFSGRLVYLFTGVERAGTREAMARALERHGATVLAYDGNRLAQLGPERFPAEAMVIVETRQLSHSANDLLVERARASGVWVYVGPTGPAGLARRVAERWSQTHGLTGDATG